MVYLPLHVTQGRTQVVAIRADLMDDPEALEDVKAEEARRAGVREARAFYEGSQYDDRNAAEALDRGCLVENLDEHERLVAYSTHIAESIDFVADQLADGFSVTFADQSAEQVVMEAVTATDILTSDDDDVDIYPNHVLGDALTAGDVAVEVRWNPFTQSCFYEFWQSENVQFTWSTAEPTPERVSRREWRWVVENGHKKEIEEEIVYSLQTNAVGIRECRRDVYWDDDDTPRESRWLGLPFVPWRLLRGSGRRRLREQRGVPFISTAARSLVRRFDALEQYGFIVARYNSHGNLVVVGDGASLQISQAGGTHKDVADVLEYPDGTKVFPLSLPTDPRMLDHQKKVIEEAIYRRFGLTRVEPDTLDGLGDVSGYALEILNRKTSGTLGRIAAQFGKDLIGMFNMTLDVYAYATEARMVVPAEDDEEFADWDPDVPLSDDDVPVLPLVAFWDVNPEDAFPNRGMDVDMGNGYIVDAVAIRDDYTAGLISRAEGLRRRGKTEDEIRDIQNEIRDEQPTEATVGSAARAALEGRDSGTGRGTLDSTEPEEGEDDA